MVNEYIVQSLLVGGYFAAAGLTARWKFIKEVRNEVAFQTVRMERKIEKYEDLQMNKYGAVPLSVIFGALWPITIFGSTFVFLVEKLFTFKLDSVVKEEVEKQKENIAKAEWDPDFKNWYYNKIP